MEQIKTKKVEVRNLSKIFFQKNSSFEVVKDVSFDVYDGEFLVLLGPGRCGKTVLLNMLIGTETRTSGEIHINGAESPLLLCPWSSKKKLCFLLKRLWKMWSLA